MSSENSQITELDYPLLVRTIEKHFCKIVHQRKAFYSFKLKELKILKEKLQQKKTRMENNLRELAKKLKQNENKKLE